MWSMRSICQQVPRSQRCFDIDSSEKFRIAQRPPSAVARALDGIDIIDGVDGIDCGHC
jgi:hypothetical protein